MYLTGHTGLTLGVVTLLQRGKGPMSKRKIAAVTGFALMPDILDRFVHLVVPGYPDHGVFHSVFFYALAVPLVFLFMRRALPYISIMAMHIFFDLVNVDPRAFIYPHYGWLKPVYTDGKPFFLKLDLLGLNLNLNLGLNLRGYVPSEFFFRFPFGHYLIFEALGAIVILAVLIGRLGGRRAVIYLPERRGPESTALAEARSD